MTDATNRPPLEFETLPRLVANVAARHPARDALIFPSAQLTDARRTWSALFDGALAMARALKAQGVGRGDRVGLFMPNSIDFVECLVGTSLLGAIPVPINVRYRMSELAFVIADARLAMLVTSSLAREHADLPRLVCDTFPNIRVDGRPGMAVPQMVGVVDIAGDTRDGLIGRQAFLRQGDEVDDAAILVQLAETSVDDPALIVYTSGTTAHPKGCVLSHRAWVGNGIAMGRQRFHLTPADRFWDPLPMFHMAALLQFTAVADAGAAFLSMVHLEIDLALQMLETERATICYSTFPTITADLINHPTFGERDLSAIRRVNGVAPPETLRIFQNAFPQAIQTSAYGLTEAGGVIAHNDPEESLESRLTTCGRPLDDIDVRIVDPETGTDVTGRASGEIQIRGYCLFDGYFGNPDATAATMDGDWLKTGDLGSIDANGCIRYEGRTKDMLKVGGENVSALEVESFLATHPKVKLVQVVGAPDPRLVEVPVAFVELAPGATADEAELIDYCRGRIGSFKVPRAVHFVTDWPMSATKIQKFRLRERLADG